MHPGSGSCLSRARPQIQTTTLYGFPGLRLAFVDLSFSLSAGGENARFTASENPARARAVSGALFR